MAEEISAAVSKLTGEAQTNGEVYVSAVKKAAAKVSCVSADWSVLGCVHVARICYAALFWTHKTAVMITF